MEDILSFNRSAVVSSQLKHSLPFKSYFNALAFVTRRLIGQSQKFAAIYCRKLFDVINYVIFRLVTCSFMRLATLKLRDETAEVN